MNKYKTLYKLDTKGKIREWHMEVDGAKFRTVAGIKDGKLVTSEWTETIAKNVGRSNATTAEEQAIAEVEAQYKKQQDKGYKDTIDENLGALSFVKPMLAHKWEDRLDKIKFEDGVYVQPKLDGIRCVFTKDGPKSRSGKDIVAIPHIVKALAPIFENVPNLILDGELYNHDLKEDFNKIVSLVRKTKPTADDLVECEQYIEYHVYDLPSSSQVFSGRSSSLQALLGTYTPKYIKFVPTEQAFNEVTVDELYGKYLEQGYEGGIIRLNEVYENKRSNSLLKRKDFEDAEFEIIRIEEGLGNWSGMAKRIIFRNNDGREVGAGLKGTQDYARQLLVEANDYIGKQVTVQFFTRTPDGVPRFPIAKALHKDKRW